MTKPTLTIRNATPEDVDGISHLVEKVYVGMPPYPKDMIRGQINNFPEGHFVAVHENLIIGYCASIRLPEPIALRPHTWREATGGGYGTSHDPDGEYLYGYEICVDPDKRRYRIGQRFYNERKKLCKFLRLRGIVFAGRMPLLAKKLKSTQTVEDYIKLVQQKAIRDPVLSFQIRNGFEVIGVLQNYLPTDRDSLGYAAHMLWRNPEFKASETPTSEQGENASLIKQAAFASPQFNTNSDAFDSFDEFEELVTYFVDVVADYKCDFVLFPELFTLQLLSIENDPIPPHLALAKIADEYTQPYRDMFYKLAMKFNINIIGGSHPTRGPDNEIYNVAHIFLRDGSIHEQVKIHATPNERYWWNIQGGSELSVINTDCCPIGVLVCYDSEFPELSRHLVNQGAQILFVPFLTDERHAYLRVRYCAQARAVENQVYVVTSGNVGNLPKVHNMDIQYAQSSILTPCDFPFSRDGIAADTTPNVETVAFADVHLDSLLEARTAGSVQNLKDRRHDLYRVQWKVKTL